jgi:hypothetical protein
MVWIWQHDTRTDDYKIILNCLKNAMKNKKKDARKCPSIFKLVSFLSAGQTSEAIAFTMNIWSFGNKHF